MEIEPKDLEKFKRLGVQSIAALATISPVAYEDKRIQTQMQVDKMQVIDATVEHISRSPNRTLITLFVHNFNHKLEAVLFNPKPYQLHHFILGEQNFFYGKISCNNGHCQMTHPLQVTKVGTIIPKYKTVLRADVIRRLIEKYVTRESLVEENLPQGVVTLLMSIHYPTQDQGEKLSQHQLQALKFTELYDYMKVLSNKRRFFPSLYQFKNDWKTWASTLPFELTTEQKNTISAVADDLSKDIAAKRMVVGDVGSGKTMVILAAALMSRPHKAILMAPTTILANQLFEEAQKHLPDLNSILITNSTKKSLDLTNYDFLIGTHALLHRELPEAGLIMIDEQHRFGTAQRNKLEKLVSGLDLNNQKSKSQIHSTLNIQNSKLDKRPHFLQFSATPIPRTQAMIDSAHIDVSLITQTPFEKDIDTKVIHKSDFPTLLEKIEEEIKQEHQVLLIYPLVEQSDALDYQSIAEARTYWEKRFDKVYVTHGKDKQKEAVLTEFKDKGNILLATTVVEVGISLPRLTTIVIVGAERLGLSTLHQLRGRVSRNGLKGYCYLYTNQEKSSRLNAFVKTDNGFDIAALDLRFRKSGDLLVGKTQSGDKFRWVDIGEDEAIVKKVKEHLSTDFTD